MFVFADAQAHEDIMLQKENNPEFDELVIRKVDDAADVLEALRPLDPTEDGTVVTSFYDWSRIDGKWREAGIFPVISEGALRATLGILERAVRGGYVRS